MSRLANLWLGVIGIFPAVSILASASESEAATSTIYRLNGSDSAPR